jgi:hypothetical protein
VGDKSCRQQKVAKIVPYGLPRYDEGRFIVEQQTQFASKIGQLEDIVARKGVPSRHVFACENISARLRCR